MCTHHIECRHELQVRLVRHVANTYMLQANEDLALWGSLEVDREAVQVNSPSQA